MAKYSFSKCPAAEILIVCLSIISGFAALGISSLLLRDITSPTYIQTNTISVIILCIGIFSIILQLIVSASFWFRNQYQKQESKSLIYGFACGQSVIQTVLLLCLGFVTYKYFKFSQDQEKTPTGQKQDPSSAPSPSHSMGHGFWIIISANVIFHILAVLYLIRHVLKKADDEELEEMTAVVVHRRVPSRIPSQRSKTKKGSKRHGGFQMAN